MKIAMGYVGWALLGIVAGTSNWATPTLETAIFKFCPLFLLGGLLVIAAMLAMSKTAHETGSVQSANEDGPGYGSAKESANINGKECE
jgi:hydrogenase/urease accessory protein HupE